MDFMTFLWPLNNSFGSPQVSIFTHALMLPFLTDLSPHFRKLTHLHKGNFFSRTIFREYLPPSYRMNYSQSPFPDDFC